MREWFRANGPNCRCRVAVTFDGERRRKRVAGALAGPLLGWKNYCGGEWLSLSWLDCGPLVGNWTCGPDGTCAGASGTDGPYCVGAVVGGAALAFEFVGDDGPVVARRIALQRMSFRLANLPGSWHLGTPWVGYCWF